MTLLIDGRNTAYRSVYASKKNPVLSTYHPFTAWLYFASVWINKFKPTDVLVFWDCPKDTVWRRKIAADYKEGRGCEEVQGQIESIEKVGCAILPNVNCRLVSRQGQEADDMIYAAARVLSPRDQVIISADSDLIQIAWSMPHVKCYDPREGEFIQPPVTNPVMIKALAGDSTDNVDGYRGIGEVKGRDLALDFKELHKFLGAFGDTTFKRNLALIDLSLNPLRLANEIEVMRVMAAEPVFDKPAIMRLATEHRVRGLIPDFARIVLPFKSIRPQLQGI